MDPSTIGAAATTKSTIDVRNQHNSLAKLSKVKIYFLVIQ